MTTIRDLTLMRADMNGFVYNGKLIKRVGFFGLGKSNLGVMEYLSKKYDGLKFTLRSDKDIVSDTAERVTKFDVIHVCESAFSEPYEDILFLAPSVRRDRSEIQKMAGRGVIISSDAEFFFDNVQIPIFGVSGSDGKSTTATLASLMLWCNGASAPAIGNVGVAMTPWLGIGTISYAVTELSSFQLMNFEPRCKRALITNITPNHLDWHSSYEEYISAKENLLRSADERAFNLDCLISRELISRHSANVVYSQTLSLTEMRSLAKTNVYIYLSDGFITANDEKILYTGAIKHPTKHTINNFMAAISLTYGHTTRMRISEIAGSFSGLAHRCESVGRFDGIEFVNSSIDSSPKRTATTLSSFDKRVIAIIGGRSKGLDYAELLPAMKERVKFAVLTGETGREVEALLRGGDLPFKYESSFDDAVLMAIRYAKDGDTVLLSPASTSFDRFRNFEERGERFKEIIRNHYYKKGT